jgi:hypothetical protein
VSGSSAQPATRRGRLRARGLVVLASIVLVIAVLTTWVRAEIIDTNGWTQTSVRLLENEKIRQAVADGLSERLLKVVDVEDVAAEKLPSGLARLAPVLSTAAAQVLPQAVDKALTIPAVQSWWGQGHRRAHGQVLRLLDGGSSALSTNGGVVTLELEVLLDRIGQRLGVGDDVGAKLPPSARRIVLLRSNELKLAQNTVKALRGLSFVLPLLVALMYIGALWLARGGRRRVLLEIGAGIIAAALVSLVLRRWIISYVVGALVHDESLRPAVREILQIATGGWRERVLWLLVTGALVLFAGWIAGPMRTAVRLRAKLAAPLELHRAWFVAGVVALVLLIAALGPARTPGQAIPLLIEAALAIVGVLALRRQVINEQRDAPSPLAAPSPAEPREAGPGRD